MAELIFKKLADAPILDEVPDGAKVYAEVDGKVYRVAGDNLGGGGIPTAILTIDMSSTDSKSAAGDNSRASSSVFTATCDNMTFDEAKAIFESGGQINAMLRATQPGENSLYFRSYSVDSGYVSMQDAGTSEFIGFTFFPYISGYDAITFYWKPDDTISTQI